MTRIDERPDAIRPGVTKTGRRRDGLHARSEELFDFLYELRVRRVDARIEALHLLAAAVDQVLVEVPARRGAGGLGEIGVQRAFLQVDLGEHREVDRVLV